MVRKTGGSGWPDQRGFAIDFNDDQEQVVDFVYEESDAYLIAAAPDLLEALEWSISKMISDTALTDPHGRTIERIEKDGMLPAQIYRARAAIAKAKGLAK